MRKWTIALVLAALASSAWAGFDEGIEAYKKKDFQTAPKEYASRPRKAFVGPRTRYASHAQYLMNWSTKVARVGELSFPRNAIGSLCGSVQIHVEVRADGLVAKAEILRPDPNPKINDAALRIIHIAEPFSPFPPEIRKDYDILEFVRTLTFTREDLVLQ